MPHLATYVGLVDRAERTLADSFRVVADAQAEHPEVYFLCRSLAAMSDHDRELLGPVARRYGEETAGEAAEPERLHAAGLGEARAGPLGLLRDLQDLHVLATLVQTSWTVILQAAQGLRDHELIEIAQAAGTTTSRQLTALNTHLKTAAPQALIVAS
jgi:voltage-gated potassium channel Kch